MCYPPAKPQQPSQERAAAPPAQNAPQAPPAPRMYNFFWVYPAPPTDEGVRVNREKGNKINSRGIEAVILYPALATPEIVVGNEKIQFFILIRDKPKGAKKALRLEAPHVNVQLKYSSGLDATKPYLTDSLFRSEVDKNIQVSEVEFNEGITDIGRADENRFSCIWDHRAMKVYQDAGFKKLYRVQINAEVLLRPSPPSSRKSHSERAKDQRHVRGKESQDQILRDKLGGIYDPERRRFKKKGMNGPRIVDRGRYCFKVERGDVDVTTTDPGSPLQAYHPVFLYSQMSYAGLGHLADLHICSRQSLMAKSKARVIEYMPGNVEDDLDVSPHIGKLVNVSSRNVKRLLDKLGRDPDVQVVLIGGDLIDFIKSWCASARTRPEVDVANPTIRQIWDQVAVNDGYEDRYQDHVDLIIFYSLLVDFYRQHGKPVFVVSGNHDCYYRAFGISPRVAGKRANEGIPADHNMTFYEALLCFGDTYSALKKENVSGLFTSDKFAWYYTMLTPVSDFVAHLPKQSLVGLAWGDDESLIDVVRHNQGFGHLPRANKSVSDKQLDVVKRAVKKAENQSDRRVILTSHFTFVSYVWDVPFFTWNNKAKRQERTEGAVQYGAIEKYAKYDIGTFEVNRKAIFQLLLDKKIHCVLTGHSHHRSLYGITDKTWGLVRDSVHNRAYRFEEFAQLKDAGLADNVIIVSDSAGPIPRLCYGGEFSGYGSDRCSGTVVKYGADGKIAEVRAVPVGPKPRISVSLDYMDLYVWRLSGHPLTYVVQKFVSDQFSKKDENQGILPQYRFRVELNEEIHKWVRVAGIRLYLIWPEQSVYRKVTFQRDPLDASEQTWLVNEADSVKRLRLFAKYFAGGRKVFMGMKFKPAPGAADAMASYDFDHTWLTTECQLSEAGHFNIWHKAYQIDRNCSRAEVPDYAYRKTALRKYS